jgi:hypothetical protein
MTIHLRIDHLLVDGVELAPVELARFQEALESELARLLEAPDALDSVSHGYALEAVRTEPIALAEGWDGTSLARQVASAVYGGLPR